MALNMSSKRRRIRGAFEMTQPSIGTSKALIRPTIQCTPRFWCIRCFCAEQVVFSCKVLAVLCFCTQRACLNLSSLVLRWINKYDNAADKIDDTEANKDRYSRQASNNAAKRDDTAAPKKIQPLQKKQYGSKRTQCKTYRNQHRDRFHRHVVFKLLMWPCFCSSLHNVSGLLGLGLWLVQEVASHPYSCIRKTIPSCSSGNKTVVKHTMSVQQIVGRLFPFGLWIKANLS